VRQDAPFTKLRSRFAQRLNVPKRTPRLFARCGLAGQPFEHPADYSGTITLSIITTACRAKTEFSRKLLEWTAHGALKPRERQGEFEARQIVIHSDLALDPLGIEDIQEAGGALAEA
jgi:hypothetical protein